MKRSLPVCILLFFVYAAGAQTMKLRDSVFMAHAGSPFAFYGITTFQYNSDCRLQTSSNPSTQVNYEYYPDGSIYQETYLNYNADSNAYINTFRFFFAYNAAGKMVSDISQSWNKDSGRFVNNYEYDYLYTNDTVPFHTYSKRWDGTTGTWVQQSESVYYVNSMNQVDSIITYNSSIANYQSLQKIYFTYYTSGSQKSLQRNYYYYNGVFTALTKTLQFNDSSNYLMLDSVVYESYTDTTKAPDHVSTYAYVEFYDVDGTNRETDFNQYDSYAPNNPIYSVRSYHFYGPCPSALPVSFLSFAGKYRDNDVVLNWQTGTEINTALFAIQRSTDGIHFTTIGSVPATGNTSAGYTYTDRNAALLSAPKLYYRLAETDKDGSTHYSRIATLGIASGKVFITASPNPAANVVKIYSSVTLKDATITVSDMRGRQVYSAKQNIAAGSSIPVEISAFAKGIYIVTVQSALYKQQVKVVKE